MGGQADAFYFVIVLALEQAWQIPASSSFMRRLTLLADVAPLQGDE